MDEHLLDANISNLLSAFADTLDSIPPEMCRSFADLRELDAVLCHTISSVTSKLTQLASAIQDPDVPPSSRLGLLINLADESRLISQGSSDKIRVNTKLCDTIKSHSNYMAGILAALRSLGSDFTASLPDTSIRPSKLGDPKFVPPQPVAQSRRDLMANSTAAAVAAAAAAQAAEQNNVHATPVPGSTKKRRTNASTSNNQQEWNSPSKQQNSPNVNAGRKRRKQGANATDSVINGNTAAVRRRKRGGSVSSSHGSSDGGITPWNNNRGAAVSSEAGKKSSAVATVTAAVEDPQDPADTTTYCFCRMTSHGEMVGCDDENCEIEWFHLPCVGLSQAPEGRWFCSDCITRQSRARRQRR